MNFIKKELSDTKALLNSTLAQLSRFQGSGSKDRVQTAVCHGPYCNIIKNTHSNPQIQSEERSKELKKVSKNNKRRQADFTNFKRSPMPSIKYMIEEGDDI